MHTKPSKMAPRTKAAVAYNRTLDAAGLTRMLAESEGDARFASISEELKRLAEEIRRARQDLPPIV